MKTYRIKDEDGKVLEVNEYEEGEKPEEAQPAPAPQSPEEGAKDEAFTPEQKAAIKEIVAEALAEALKAKENPAPAPEAPETHDEDVDAAKEDNGEGGAIGNVNAPDKVGDSAKKAAGSVEPQPTKVDDSIVDEEEVNSTWANRFSKDK